MPFFYTNENEKQVVSGRELHKFLDVKTKYVNWIKRKIKKYGFIENVDFITIAQKRATVQDNYIIFLYGKFVLVTQKKVTNNPKNPYTEITDHLMKISIAKEVAILF